MLYSQAGLQDNSTEFPVLKRTLSKGEILMAGKNILPHLSLLSVTV